MHRSCILLWLVTVLSITFLFYVDTGLWHVICYPTEIKQSASIILWLYIEERSKSKYLCTRNTHATTAMDHSHYDKTNIVSTFSEYTELNTTLEIGPSECDNKLIMQSAPDVIRGYIPTTLFWLDVRTAMGTLGPFRLSSSLILIKPCTFIT